MEKKNGLIGLAKGKATQPIVVNKKTVIKKPELKKPEPPKTPDELRDIKAKQKIAELLDGVELSPNPVPHVTEPIMISKETKEGDEWLQEQVGLLSEENERLKEELDVAKGDYTKLFQQVQNRGGGNELGNETLTHNIVLFFTDMQDNFMGQNPERIRYDVAYPRVLLPMLVQLFPFLENYKKF